MNIDEHWTDLKNIIISHRIHGAGIYANIWGIFMVNVTIIYIYSSTWIIYIRLVNDSVTCGKSRMPDSMCICNMC